jgi:hypothetical protein
MRAPAPAGTPSGAWADAVRQVASAPVFWLLAVVFTLYFGAFSALALHLYPLLIERGASPELTVLVIGLIGPAQVLGRLLLWKFGAGLPIRSLGIATLASLCLGLALLHWAGAGAVALVAFGLIYGAGNGILTIVRGLVVPEMLSRRDYGTLNGLLAAPSMVAKALAPVAAAWVWTRGSGYDAVVDVVLACSLLGLAGFAAAAFLNGRTDDEDRHPQ